MLFLTVFKSLKNKNKQMFVNLDRKLKNQQNVNINIEYKTFLCHLGFSSDFLSAVYWSSFVVVLVH